MIDIECKCGRKWLYKGRNKYYATCPDCRSMVKLREGQG